MSSLEEPVFRYSEGTLTVLFNETLIRSYRVFDLSGRIEKIGQSSDVNELEIALRGSGVKIIQLFTN